MGRGLLVFVILMTTLFAGIVTRIQRNVGGVPDTLIKNQLNQELENVSDFVLRKSVKAANSQTFLEAFLQETSGQSSSTTELSFTEYYGVPEGSQAIVRPARKIGNCELETITYTYNRDHKSYKVISTIRGTMQGISMVKTAEMAFSFPMTVLGKIAPNIVYLEFEQLMFLPWLRQLLQLLFGIKKEDFADSSPNNYAGEFHGFTFWSATGVDTVRVKDGEVESWEDSYSKRFLKLNGYDHRVYVKRKIKEEQPDGFKDLDTDDSFTLLTFAKIDKKGRYTKGGFLGIGSEDYRKRQGTIIWIPTEPNVPAMQSKPAAGIWFEPNNNGKGLPNGKLHFYVTQDKAEGESTNKYLEVVGNYELKTDVWKWEPGFLGLFGGWKIDPSHKSKKWNSYALTYEVVNGQAILSAYVDGKPFGTPAKNNNPIRAYESIYGMTLGARDIREANGKEALNNDEKRMHLFGIIDQSGMDDKAFTPAEVEMWHNQVLKSTLVKYIRD